MDSLFGNIADAASKQYSFREHLIDEKVEKLAPKQVGPPTPRAKVQSTPAVTLNIERVSWPPMESWSTLKDADRARLIGRFSSTFIYNVGDNAFAKRATPYLVWAYLSGFALYGVWYALASNKERRNRAESMKGRVSIDDIFTSSS